MRRWALGLLGCCAIGGTAMLYPSKCAAKEMKVDPLEQVLERLERIEKKLLADQQSPNLQNYWADKDMSQRLFSRDEVQREVRRMAKQVSKDYFGKDLLVVGLMSGVFMFMADFVREIEIAHEIQFVAVSSYGSGTISSGNVKIKKDLETPVYGKHVLLLDEICDSGHTLASLEALMRDRGAASVKSCVLLDKVSRRTVPIQPEYVGLICPDEFVVGYGMDYRERYRSLPYIGVLKPEQYA